MEGCAIQHRLGNLGVVKEYRHLGRRNIKPTTAADADLWMGMLRYHDEWDHKTPASWVLAHAEEGGWLTDSHEKENKKADEVAGYAYTHLDAP